MKSSARQLKLLLDFLPRLYEPTNLESFPRHMIDTLPALIPTDSIGYNDLNVRNRRISVLIDPPSESYGIEDSNRVFLSLIHQQPLVNYQQKTGDTRALRLSDFVSLRQFHQLGIYRDFYRKMGIEQMLTASFPDGSLGDQLALVLTREGADFLDEEQELLNFIRPHFVQAHRNAFAFSRLERDLDQTERVFETKSCASLVQCHGASIRRASRRASALLARYFPGGESSRDRRLPDEVERWARRCQELFRSERSVTVPAKPLIKDGVDARLVVRFLPDLGSDFALLLEERPYAAANECLAQLGLSLRQAEVLLWIARGKTNSEIATILNVRHRTIDKHVEHIFEHLGVEKGMGAAAIAWKTLDFIAEV